ncbi:gluconate 2-dehydrogenase subunit 3 family protein [Sphingomonas lenta]|uniref:Transcriptional initiation protein Tat n=1 Tax=Sphingomonas lenta TaxID=1141887 RepID=A0A2A2SFG2_9SPHN|nr:gluconate 2-dehydrogenase subunit 3 family protein [Sphingomonas lenta]PAX07751.1 transcriptional initiation protein Tat [Sphingomonas lenta]
MIDRRDALKGVAAMFGANLFAPIGRALAQTAPAAAGAMEAPSAPVFAGPQRALVTALSERIIPTTDTPGAIAAGVPAYIEKLLADWALPGEKTPILAGLDALDARSRADFRVAAAQASPAQQDALLTLSMNDQVPGAGAKFFEALRQLVITGYYTSEIGITQERVYVPVPGRYDGAHPYAEVNRVYSG